MLLEIVLFVAGYLFSAVPLALLVGSALGLAFFAQRGYMMPQESRIRLVQTARGVQQVKY